MTADGYRIHRAFHKHIQSQDNLHQIVYVPIEHYLVTSFDCRPEYHSIPPISLQIPESFLQPWIESTRSFGDSPPTQWTDGGHRQHTEVTSGHKYTSAHAAAAVIFTEKPILNKANAFEDFKNNTIHVLTSHSAAINSSAYNEETLALTVSSECARVSESLLKTEIVTDCASNHNQIANIKRQFYDTNMYSRDQPNAHLNGLKRNGSDEGQMFITIMKNSPYFTTEWQPSDC
jgi:hypothetical protein